MTRYFVPFVAVCCTLCCVICLCAIPCYWAYKARKIMRERKKYGLVPAVDPALAGETRGSLLNKMWETVGGGMTRRELLWEIIIPFMRPGAPRRGTLMEMAMPDSRVYESGQLKADDLAPLGAVGFTPPATPLKGNGALEGTPEGKEGDGDEEAPSSPLLGSKPPEEPEPEPEPPRQPSPPPPPPPEPEPEPAPAVIPKAPSPPPSPKRESPPPPPPPPPPAAEEEGGGSDSDPDSPTTTRPPPMLALATLDEDPYEGKDVSRSGRGGADGAGAAGSSRDGVVDPGSIRVDMGDGAGPSSQRNQGRMLGTFSDIASDPGGNDRGGGRRASSGSRARPGQDDEPPPIRIELSLPNMNEPGPPQKKMSKWGKPVTVEEDRLKLSW